MAVDAINPSENRVQKVDLHICKDDLYQHCLQEHKFGDSSDIYQYGSSINGL